MIGKFLLTFTIQLLVFLSFSDSDWGFFGHRMITRLAVFSLPEEIYPFYRNNIQLLAQLSVKPDQRRYAVPWEGQRHYLDMDAYPDSVIFAWRKSADYTDSIDADFRQRHGDLPRQVNIHHYLLTEAMASKNIERILVLSAELSHYIADAHVPLHTTSNYNGQQTGQEGIHGLWETRIPELFFPSFEMYGRKAEYVENPYQVIWQVLLESHSAVDSVLRFEKRLGESMKTGMMSHERRGVTTSRQFSTAYASAYREVLDGMVERRMQNAAVRIADSWYTCWINAGMPALSEPYQLVSDSTDQVVNKLKGDSRSSLHD